MRCPKCGSGNEAGAWVCGRCEYVLDTSFLGDDILNDPAVPPPAAPASVQTKPVKAEGPSRDEIGGDALILGRLDDGEIQSFVSDRTGGFLPVQSDAIEEEAPASVYIGGDVAAQLAPTAVLRHCADAEARRSALSKFEAFVFDLIDGRRNLGEVRGRTGLSQGDVRIAVAMLLDKHMVESAAASPMSAARHATEAPVRHTPLAPGDETSELSLAEDATRELPVLPPLADDVGEPSWVEEPAPVPSPPQPPPPAFDELEMKPLPAPPPAAPARDKAPAPPPAAAPPAGFRPAARVAPLRPIRHTPPPPPKQPVAAPPASAPPLPSPARSYASPATTAHPAADPKVRAAEYYELALKDLREGRPARAFSYARMAADADPREEKYQTLLRDWNKASARGTDGDPVSAAQQAEAAGDFEQAIVHMRKACEQFPKSAPLFNRLAVLLATRAHDFRPAYNAAMRAVELEPENATYKSNMMKILARVDADDDPDRAKPAKAGLFGGLLKR